VFWISRGEGRRGWWELEKKTALSRKKKVEKKEGMPIAQGKDLRVIRAAATAQRKSSVTKGCGDDRENRGGGLREDKALGEKSKLTGCGFIPLRWRAGQTGF